MSTYRTFVPDRKGPLVPIRRVSTAKRVGHVLGAEWEWRGDEPALSLYRGRPQWLDRCHCAATLVASSSLAYGDQWPGMRMMGVVQDIER